MQGRFWWNKRTEDGLHKGIEYFHQAIEKDPNYALAYAGLADCYSGLAAFGFSPSTEVFPKAKEAALKALELDDSLAEAHTSLGYVEFFYEWDWAGGEREFQRAIGLDPSYATAPQQYAFALMCVARFKEADAEAKRALALDPLSLVANEGPPLRLYYARQYDQAIEQERKVLELDPNFTTAHDVIGGSLIYKSMYKEGIAELKKSLAIRPGDIRTLGLLGYAYATSGQETEARKVLGQLDQLSREKYVEPTLTARIHAALGEKDKAFQWLEKAYEQRSWFLAPLRVDRAYDPLRSDPRFQDLLRRMNLQP